MKPSFPQGLQAVGREQTGSSHLQPGDSGKLLVRGSRGLGQGGGGGLHRRKQAPVCLAETHLWENGWLHLAGVWAEGKGGFQGAQKAGWRKYCEGLLMVAMVTDTAGEAWRPAPLPQGEASAKGLEG